MGDELHPHASLSVATYLEIYSTTRPLRRRSTRMFTEHQINCWVVFSEFYMDCMNNNEISLHFGNLSRSPVCSKFACIIIVVSILLLCFKLRYQQSTRFHMNFNQSRLIALANRSGKVMLHLLSIFNDVSISEQRRCSDIEVNIREVHRLSSLHPTTYNRSSIWLHRTVRKKVHIAYSPSSMISELCVCHTPGLPPHHFQLETHSTL